jgi:hypothetical protein
MSISSVLLIILGFGLPVAVLTWYLFLRLYDRGDLDRSLDRNSLGPHLKALKKQHKKQRKNKESLSTHLVHDRWMKFGGGFYGLATLWTLAVVEVVDISGFVFNFPGFAVLFEDGLISFLVHAFVNQMMNLVSALTWFIYWGEDRGGNIFVAPIVGYIAYLLGLRLARENVPLDKGGIKAFAKSFFAPKDPEK